MCPVWAISMGSSPAKAMSLNARVVDILDAAQPAGSISWSRTSIRRPVRRGTRCLFSATQIGRLLGVPVQTFDFARTFGEIEVAARQSSEMKPECSVFNEREVGMLIKEGHSLLLLIDLQERLAPAIRDIDAVLRHNLWLVAVAQRLGVPVAATVQAGLGPMAPELTRCIPAADVVEKIHFSAVADGWPEALPGFSRRQVVLTEPRHTFAFCRRHSVCWNEEVFVSRPSARGGRRRTGARAPRAAGCRIVRARWWPSNGCTRPARMFPRDPAGRPR